MFKLKFTLTVALVSLLALTVTAQQSTTNIVLKSQVEWEDLNPARGDKSPKAGTLWGDRKGTEATGFLLNPIDGFESPPHIHNVTYRGVVISGLIHNDDPNATSMWMPAGSFWTQPKGESHITAAKGTNTLAYIEIEQGPYLVKPADEAFDSGERPVNLDKSNIVWVDANNISWIKKKGNTAKVAFLWGSPKASELRGNLVKLPAGFDGEIKSGGTTFGAVVIKGEPTLNNTTLETGSYFSSTGKASHKIVATTETILYVRTDATFEIKE